VLDGLDRFQRRHAWLGFPLAVRQKYADDQGAYIAASVAYYAFFSVFPLLLVLTAVLGYVLAGHPKLEHDIVDSALGQFPVIGEQLHTGSLTGSALGLTLGIAGALWAGMAGVLALENALNRIWGVPAVDRPGFLPERVRALALLLVLGGGVLGTTALSSLASAGTGLGVAWQVLSVALSTTLDFVLFLTAFRILLAADVSLRAHWPGAAFAAVGYELLQLGGGYYVGHTLKNASNTYGTFALVIGLLSFIYLAVHVVLLGAEVSAVRERRLWPRSLSLLSERPATPADVAAFEQRLAAEVRRRDEHVTVSPPPGTE
jgi:membrane protein